jgi:hypothetical protein
MLAYGFLIVSALLQVCAAVLAFRLVLMTGRKGERIFASERDDLLGRGACRRSG